jgi:hypothetical protein
MRLDKFLFYKYLTKTVQNDIVCAAEIKRRANLTELFGISNDPIGYKYARAAAE